MEKTISLENYRKRFDYILWGLVAYSVVFLFVSRHALYDLFRTRTNNPDFYLGLILMVVVLLFYKYYTVRMSNYDDKEMTEEDKEHMEALQTSIGHLKMAIISGLSAIVIGTFAKINKIIPAFFITLVISYYAGKNL